MTAKNGTKPEIPVAVDDSFPSTRLPIIPGFPKTLGETLVGPMPSQVRNLVAGGFAGMAAKSLVAPLDRIKILFQVSPEPFRLACVPRVAMTICREEGVSALWKGNTATLIRVFPYAGIQFMTFDWVKKYFIAEENRLHMTSAESLVAGSSAGVVSVLLTYPLDLTRAQLAVLKKNKTGPNQGFVQVIGSTYKERGVPGLYRGISPTLLGILPYAGVAFTINEQLKRKIMSTNDRDPTLIEKLLSGGLSGLVAQSLTYPLEITRRRMQTVGLVSCNESSSLLRQPGAPETGHRAKEVPLSMHDTMRTLLKEQGWRGLFKGLSMNWVKGPIAFSISFTTYDYLKVIFAVEGG
eukprot:CAMPEP_0194268696 /NCGR_PEP_ID=MMETSP0169-20130528/2961_1 /TAXON_ID=218684 /ORGANISM="Corethron pennatum, Strain L29A3" /LENGTH=350 /DNA_ID=CAMNT_0039010017 /DNA_START=231 /DNA_END=1283 /DNA_ORIENTATION=+